MKKIFCILFIAFSVFATNVLDNNENYIQTYNKLVWQSYETYKGDVGLWSTGILTFSDKDYIDSLCSDPALADGGSLNAIMNNVNLQPDNLLMFSIFYEATMALVLDWTEEDNGFYKIPGSSKIFICLDILESLTKAYNDSDAFIMKVLYKKLISAVNCIKIYKRYRKHYQNLVVENEFNVTVIPFGQDVVTMFGPQIGLKKIENEDFVSEEVSA